MIALAVIAAFYAVLSVALMVAAPVWSLAGTPKWRARSSATLQARLLATTTGAMTVLVGLSLLSGDGRHAITTEWRIRPAGLTAAAAVVVSVAASFALYYGEAFVVRAIRRRADPRGPRPAAATVSVRAGLTRRGLGRTGWVMLTALCASAVLEEMIWRGYLMTALSAGDGWRHALLAALVSAAAFGLSHVVWGPLAMAAKTVDGLVWAWLFAATGTLLWCVVSHAVFNSLVVAHAGARRAVPRREQP